MGHLHTIEFPDIGEGVVEGEVIEWLKQVGDKVERDEPIVSVMTDKATVELPSPYAGKLVKQYYQSGETALVDQPLYDIETEEEAPIVQEPVSNRALATPPTRKLARDLGVDINIVPGSGKEGRVTEGDVVSYHASLGKEKKKGQRASPNIRSSTPILHMPDDEEVPVTGLRHIIAEKMVESKYIVPHFSYFDQVDATRLIQLRDNVKKEAEKEGFKATYMPFFIRALSQTISKHPHVNSSFDLNDHTLVVHQHHNIGIATKTGQGLVVCVLKNVQDMHLDEIIKAYDVLMRKAQEGKLEREEMIGSTITISNFGPLGGMWATPIINYPEVAILGIAKIRKQPVVKNDHIVARDMLNLSWSFDHRVIDGDAASSISNTFISMIQNPAQLL